MLQKDLQFTKVCCMLCKDALLFEVVNDNLKAFFVFIYQGTSGIICLALLKIWTN